MYWVVEVPVPRAQPSLPLVRPPRAAYQRRGGGPPGAAAREAAIAHLGDRLMRQGQAAPAKAEIRFGGIAPAIVIVPCGEGRIAPNEGESRQGGLARLPDEWSGRLERIRGTLDKARRWQAWLDAEQGRRACQIAKREKVTKCRVSQVMRLLKLAPEVLADIGRPGRTGMVPSEPELRQLTKQRRAEQVRAYRELTGQPIASADARRGGARAKGFQHLFARARRYRELLESGEALSMADIARAEGITGARVSDLLYLTNLAPEIVAELDRPVELAPYIADRELRAIARVRDLGAQVKRYRCVVEGVAAK